VGAVLAKDNRSGRVYVREAPADMGAAKGGVRVGDELVTIDGNAVQTMSPDDVHKALTGQVGSRVKLTVKRDGQTVDVVVERGPLRE
jgi:carboxyl-terminal processing protease